ncbi:MAG: dicarboxylate/amino acid:cation symporter [Verrucomicrobia bacterium]|nr:dicarboxylate/amino acid:cation symporter [Verrucomicrobiota bacterium]
MESCWAWASVRASRSSSFGDILARATLLLVLPYLLFELTGLFGSLEAPALRALTRGGGLLFGFGLVLSAAQIVLLPLMLPDLPYSPAFDPRMLETPPAHSLLDAFLPENIIQDLANGNFTALVLFSGCLGLTIQRMDHREEILAVVLPIRRLFTEFFCLALDILTPIGILGIVAVSVGTMDPVDTQKLVGLLAMFLVTLLVNGGVLGLRPDHQIEGLLVESPVVTELRVGDTVDEPSRVRGSRRRRTEEEPAPRECSKRDVRPLFREGGKGLEGRILRVRWEQGQVFPVRRKAESGVQRSSRQGTVLARRKDHQESTRGEVG